MKVKVIGQKSWSKNVKILVFSLVSEKAVQAQGHEGQGQGHRGKGQGRRSRSKVEMVRVKGRKGQGQRSKGSGSKVMGQGQGSQGSRSKLFGGAFYPIDSREVRHAGIFIFPLRPLQIIGKEDLGTGHNL